VYRAFRQFHLQRISIPCLDNPEYQTGESVFSCGKTAPGAPFRAGCAGRETVIRAEVFGQDRAACVGDAPCSGAGREKVYPHEKKFTKALTCFARLLHNTNQCFIT
jgi:hypothetical protein